MLCDRCSREIVLTPEEEERRSRRLENLRLHFGKDFIKGAYEGGIRRTPKAEKVLIESAAERLNVSEDALKEFLRGYLIPMGEDEEEQPVVDET